MLILEGHAAEVCSLAYSPDGRFLASGDRHGTVNVWNTPAMTQRFRWMTAGATVSACVSLCFHPKVDVVAAGLEDGRLVVWDVVSGKCTVLEAWHEAERIPLRLAYHADGRLVAAKGRRIAEVRPVPFAETRSLVLGDYYYQSAQFQSLACGAGGVVAVGSTNLISLWTDQRVRPCGVINWPHGDLVSLNFIPGTRTLLAVRGRDAGLWDLEQPDKPRRGQVLRHQEVMRAACITSDGTRALVGGDDWSIHVWNLATGSKLTDYNFRLGPVRALAVAPDGMTAAVAGSRGQAVLVWDLE